MELCTDMYVHKCPLSTFVYVKPMKNSLTMQGTICLKESLVVIWKIENYFLSLRSVKYNG